MCVNDGFVLAFASAQRFVGMGFWHLEMICYKQNTMGFKML